MIHENDIKRIQQIVCGAENIGEKTNKKLKTLSNFLHTKGYLVVSTIIGIIIGFFLGLSGKHKQ